MNDTCWVVQKVLTSTAPGAKPVKWLLAVGRSKGAARRIVEADYHLNLSERSYADLAWDPYEKRATTKTDNYGLAYLLLELPLQ